MADVIVQATALRWVSDDFPGWIEAAVTDADGRERRLIEKVPVLTSADLGAGSPFPSELWIRAEAGDVVGGRVHAEFAAAVTTTTGLTGVDAAVDDVVWV